MISENDFIVTHDIFVNGTTSNESSVFEDDHIWKLDGKPKSSTSFLFDPFQIFEVNPQICHLVVVTVLDGFYPVGGWFQSLRSPNLYVILDVPNTPNTPKRTQTVNTNYPVWNQTFTFLINPESENILLINMMNSKKFRSDFKMGTAEINLNDLPLNREVDADIEFKQGSKANFKMTRTEDSKPDLRFSLALSQEEKEFLKKRREHAFEAMKTFLPEEDAPVDINEVPTIGVIGSGGGFRAMVGLSGALKALHNSGALDCTTYIASLSGGSWYVSYLYSQPEFPTKGPADFQEKLKANICKNNWLKLITPSRMYSYISPVLQKSKRGQPVSFTDFFGHLLGDTIMAEMKDCTKLSDQAMKLDQGQAPLPLYTCINVKKQVSARVFQDWMEFSPYEIGFAKYGTFMKTQHFGSKFFMGKLLLEFDEQPLHYLQGLWGSAFCILFKRLLQEKDLQKSTSEHYPVKLSEELINDEESVLNCFQPDTEDFPEFPDDFFCSSDEDEDYNSSQQDKDDCGFQNRSSPYQMDYFDTEGKLSLKSETSAESKSSSKVTENVRMHRSKTWMMLPKPRLPHYGKCLVKRKPTSKDKIGKSFWEKTLDNLFKSNMMNTRVGRAALIYNPMRGLNLTHMFSLSPFSPTTPEDDVDFKGHHEPTEVQAKKLFLVDSGLTFNLPFPLLMRPQRGIDIYLTFDFSARSTDDSSPFKDVILVERWAKLNDVPFPPIEEQASRYENEPLRECYLFENKNDPCCPIILHFILLNKKFKMFKTPGVQRNTEEEFEAANFSIFNDPKCPFSVFNFAYTQVSYDRLISLTEFNTLESMPMIKEQIAKAIYRKRNLHPKPPTKFSNVDCVRFKSKPGSLQKLKNYVKSMTELRNAGNENT